ncbi:unnamed protein product [Gadus morhua 'NCC']
MGALMVIFSVQPKQKSKRAGRPKYKPLGSTCLSHTSTCLPPTSTCLSPSQLHLSPSQLHLSLSKHHLPGGLVVHEGLGAGGRLKRRENEDTHVDADLYSHRAACGKMNVVFGEQKLSRG